MSQPKDNLGIDSAYWHNHQYRDSLANPHVSSKPKLSKKLAWASSVLDTIERRSNFDMDDTVISGGYTTFCPDYGFTNDATQLFVASGILFLAIACAGFLGLIIRAKGLCQAKYDCCIQFSDLRLVTAADAMHAHKPKCTCLVEASSRSENSIPSSL